jgi:hypothetical protein
VAAALVGAGVATFGGPGGPGWAPPHDGKVRVIAHVDVRPLGAWWDGERLMIGPPGSGVGMTAGGWRRDLDRSALIAFVSAPAAGAGHFPVSASPTSAWHASASTMPTARRR